MTGPDAPPRRLTGHVPVRLPISALASQASEDFRENETPTGSTRRWPDHRSKERGSTQGIAARHEDVRGAALRTVPRTDQPGINRRARRSGPMPTHRAGRGDRHGNGMSSEGDDALYLLDGRRLGGESCRDGHGNDGSPPPHVSAPCQRLKPNGGNASQAWFRRSRKRGPKGGILSFRSMPPASPKRHYQRESAAVPTALRFSTAAMPMTMPPIPPRMLMAMAESIMCLVTP